LTLQEHFEKAFDFISGEKEEEENAFFDNLNLSKKDALARAYFRSSRECYNLLAKQGFSDLKIARKVAKIN